MAIHNIHCFFDLLYRQLAMDLFHSVTCSLHSGQGLSVDVGRFDGVDLCLEGPYLGTSLF